MNLTKLTSLRILVIGDLMVDHYIWGDAVRISPEAPVPVVNVERESYVPGGAANVSCNLVGLGVQVSLLGAYGDDDGGKRLETLLKERKIQLLPQGRQGKSDTIVKTRIVVQRQQMCRIDRELSAGLYSLTESIQAGDFNALLTNVDAVLVSDYAKGVVDAEFLDLIRKCCGDQSKPPFLAMDPKPKRHLDLSGIDLLTPNRNEALQLAGLPFDHHAEFDDVAVCTRIYERFSPRNLVITLGADGMLLCLDGKILGRLPTEAREVFDVSGAGDTVVATLTAALASGQSLEDAAELANKAAGIVVSHLGTSPISAEALQVEIEK